MPPSSTRSLPQSRPLLTRRLTLKTYLPQKIYRRYLAQLFRDILYLSTTLRTLQDAEEDSASILLADRDSAAIDQLLSETHAALRRQFEALDRARQDQGFELPGYSQPLKVEVAQTSPRAGRFLDLLLLVDQLVQVIDALWLYQGLDEQGVVVDDRRRTALIAAARRPLRQATLTIVELGLQARALGWFYREGGPALALKQIADGFREQALAWGEAGYLHQGRVGLRYPDTLAVTVTDTSPAALAEAWATAGWLEESRRPVSELAPGVQVVVLNRDISGTFLIAARVNREQRQELAAAHRAMLTQLMSESRETPAPVRVIGGVR